MCKTDFNWECETYDRRFIGGMMIPIVQDDDIVIFSDCDEIVSLSTLKWVNLNKGKLPTRVNTPVYKYSFH